MPRTVFPFGTRVLLTLFVVRTNRKLKLAVLVDMHVHVDGAAADLAVLDVILITGGRVDLKFNHLTAVGAADERGVFEIHVVILGPGAYFPR